MSKSNMLLLRPGSSVRNGAKDKMDRNVDDKLRTSIENDFQDLEKLLEEMEFKLSYSAETASLGKSLA